jgi:hypothetical protein
MPRIREQLRVPETLEGCITFMEKHSHLINEDSREGEIVREVYARLKETGEASVEKAKEENPLAFLRVSYEQSVKLNAWIWGINFLVDFDANRIGKTAGSVFNGLMWMYPNNPDYELFQPYTDKWGRKIQVLQRPNIEKFLMLQDYLDRNPEMRGDPLKGLDDPDNAAKFANLQKCVSAAFKPAWPEPSIPYKKNTMWIGAPDADYHKNIIMPEWRKWMPQAIVERDSDHDKSFTLQIDFMTRHGMKKRITWEVICKSYESKDTKWSGAAVRAIVLTEGITQTILNEVRQRFQEHAFASWDFTPYEARNTGAKSSLAHKVFNRKEDLPLRYFVWSGYGIERCPDFILPDRKRNDLIRLWAGKPQGAARIHGKFYSDSPQVLSNLDREFHSLTWSKKELFCKFAKGLLFRGFDPGYDHPSACVWGLLSPNNDWYIYRIWAQAGLSIGERCRHIISLSGNEPVPYKFGKGEDDIIFRECNTLEHSERIIATAADYHLFKTDETNGKPYVQNYTKEGLVLRPSITMRPKDRANECNRMLEKNNFRKHPQFGCTPGSRVYFLINEEGVFEGLDKLENLFWVRYLQGEHMGEPRDELQSHDDDEFDAYAYLTLSPFRWSPHIQPTLIHALQ